MALTTGAHKYAYLDDVILLLVRSKIAIIGGSPDHAATLEAWARDGALEDVLRRLPVSWRPDNRTEIVDGPQSEVDDEAEIAEHAA